MQGLVDGRGLGGVWVPGHLGTIVASMQGLVDGRSLDPWTPWYHSSLNARLSGWAWFGRSLVPRLDYSCYASQAQIENTKFPTALEMRVNLIFENRH